MSDFSAEDLKRDNFLFSALTGKPIEVLNAAPPHQLALWSRILKRHLDRERALGINKHYRYDFNRHVALAAARKRVAQALKKAAP